MTVGDLFQKIKQLAELEYLLTRGIGGPIPELTSEEREKHRREWDKLSNEPIVKEEK